MADSLNTNETLELIVGWLAAIIISLLQVPQVLHTYKSRDAKGLSKGMIIMNTLASILWFTYGLIVWKAPIFVPNSLYFLANIALGWMKWKFSEHGKGMEEGVEVKVTGVITDANTVDAA